MSQDSAQRDRVDRFLAAFDRMLLRLFFRRVEMVGEENLPTSGPLLVASNHINSLVDPMLLYAFLPYGLRFLAKSTLWKHPVARYLVRLGRAIPIYRAHDPGVDTTKNVDSFARCYEHLARGGAIALFPEGISHDEPDLQPMKTGVARIALGTVARHRPEHLAVLPVGLNFDHRELFRSRVLIDIGRPIQLDTSAEVDEEDRGAVRALTDRVDEGLRAVTLNHRTWREARVVQCAAEIFARAAAPSPQQLSLADQIPLRRAFVAGYRELEESQPEAVRRVYEATEKYLEWLDRLRVEDRHVATDYSGGLKARFLGRQLWELTVWRILALVGWVLNWPPYRLTGWLTSARRPEPNARATHKLLSSLLLFPLCWFVAAVLVGWRFGPAAGVITFASAPPLGYCALRYSERWRSLTRETTAYLKLHGPKGAAEELQRRRAEVRDQVVRLVDLYRESESSQNREAPSAS